VQRFLLGREAEGEGTVFMSIREQQWAVAPSHLVQTIACLDTSATQHIHRRFPSPLRPVHCYFKQGATRYSTSSILHTTPTYISYSTSQGAIYNSLRTPFLFKLVMFSSPAAFVPLPPSSSFVTTSHSSSLRPGILTTRILPLYSIRYESFLPTTLLTSFPISLMTPRASFSSWALCYWHLLSSAV